MDLSIIIPHYHPGNHPSSIESFHNTLKQIESQKGDYEIEVIIADDGSVTHQDIQSLGSPLTDSDEQIIYQLKGNTLSNWKHENNFNYSSISHWLYLPKIKPMMSKARIGNAAVTMVSYENLFLAGDWTNTNLPATIEGAVKSGKKAALLITKND